MGAGEDREREREQHQRDREHARDGREPARDREHQREHQQHQHQHQRDQSQREQQREREQQGRVSPVVGERGVLSPDNPSSDVGSEYDDVDFADEHESEGGGDVNFAGVTSDLEVRRKLFSTACRAEMACTHLNASRAKSFDD